jgi:FkbM family methyltransferase
MRARVGEALSEALPPSPNSAPLHGTYVGGGRVLVSTLWGGRLLMPSEDLSHMPELVSHGTYDVPFTAFLQREIKPGDTVFDIGANIGIFTVLAAYQVWEMGRVIAYEASPVNLGVLRDNVTLNWLSDRVEIVPKAAAAQTGRVPFLAPHRFGGSGSLQPVEKLLVSADRRDTVDHIEVDAEPLDVHMDRVDRIALIKIDVEGAEEKVFSGMEGLLASGAVERVCFEFSRAHLGEDAEAFSRRLRGYEGDGWRFATLPASGVPEHAPVDEIIARGLVSQIVMTPRPV